jgi:hypothetical protein
MKTQTFNGVSFKEAKLFAGAERESIEKYGHPVYYLVRKSINIDKLHGEDYLSSFEESYEMTMDLGDVSAFTGGQSSVNIYGAQFLVQQGFTIEIESFKFYTGGNLDKPIIDDILYVPLFNKFFQIKGFDDINHEDYKTHGYDVVFHINVEVWNYSHELINTGKSEIDNMIPTRDNTQYIEDQNDTNNEIDVRDEINQDFNDDWQDD